MGLHLRTGREAKVKASGQVTSRTTMATICIVHHSVTGTTSRLAEAVLEGLSKVNGCVGQLFSIDGADIVEGRYHHESS
jgi:hypothetical protein